jgi:hypothetical protein
MTGPVQYVWPALDELHQHALSVAQGHQQNLDNSHRALAALPESSKGKGADSRAALHQHVNARYQPATDAVQQLSSAIMQAKENMLARDLHAASTYV